MYGKFVNVRTWRGNPSNPEMNITATILVLQYFHVFPVSESPDTERPGRICYLQWILDSGQHDFSVLKFII